MGGTWSTNWGFPIVRELSFQFERDDDDGKGKEK